MGDGTRLERGRATSLAGSNPAPSALAFEFLECVLIDGVRGVTEAHEFVNLNEPGSTPAEHPHVFDRGGDGDEDV